VLYKNGGANYRPVLTSETNYFLSGTDLVDAHERGALLLVQLYHR